MLLLYLSYVEKNSGSEKIRNFFQGHLTSRIWSRGLGFNLLNPNYYSFLSSYITTGSGYLNHMLVISFGELGDTQDPPATQLPGVLLRNVPSINPSFRQSYCP